MSTGPDPSSVADAEARAEAARAGLVDTLNQLRENLKPANVAEEVLANAKVTASTVTGQVWDVARRNPIPALLIGAGAAMLLGLGQRMSGPYEGTGSDDRDEADGEHSTPPAPQVLGPERARPIGRSPDPAEAMSEPALERDLRGGASKLGEGQPLLLAAIGVAVGAALGAALPRSGSDTGAVRSRFQTLRAAAKRIVQGQVDHLKAASTHAVEEIRLQAEESDSASETPTEAAHAVDDSLGNAVRKRDPAI